MILLQSFFADNPAIVWAVLGVILLIAEVLLVPSFFLPFALAAALVAAMVWLAVVPAAFLWQALIFSGLGVCFIPMCRWLLRNYAGKTPDINQY